MVGHALKKNLLDSFFVGSDQFDLRREEETMRMFSYYEPDHVIHLAAKVGGIKANSDNLGTFYLDNIRINTNVLEAARKSGCSKVISLLSTCVYPDKAVYPLTEDQIHNGEPHSSNFAYAYAKRMLDVQSRAYRKQYGCNFITIIPNNLFGENDNYDLNDAHVIPAIMHKVFLAKQSNEDVVLWGDGSALREFTYSGDLAKIIMFLLDTYNAKEPINVGNTQEYSIRRVAGMIAKNMGFKGSIIWNTDMPTGQLRKPSDNSKLRRRGWGQEDYTPFETALKNSCDWFMQHYPRARGVR